MTSGNAATFTVGLLRGTVLAVICSLALIGAPARADAPPAVTATPPLQVVPATSGTKNVQQRMRGCNASADARKLLGTAREAFIKNCMAPRRSHAVSRPGSQPKPDA
jgi:hypothetical protein